MPSTIISRGEVGEEDMIKALLIDDSQAFRQLLAPMLKILGLSVIGEATNGQEGLDLYKRLKPDVVFLDIVMPLMSGIEVLKQIREVNPTAIVVMLTTVAGRKDVMESKKAGASAYLLKPLEPQKVNQVINKIKQQLTKKRVGKND